MARPGLTYLEHLPVYLSIGLHGVLREHERDEGKALRPLGQAVDGVVQFRQGTWRWEKCQQAVVAQRTG